MIGEGSFSSVFLAREATADITPGAKPFREYAIKVRRVILYFQNRPIYYRQFLFQVCEKKKIVQESKSEYIFREKDILATITKHFSPRVPFFVVLHSTFHVSSSTPLSVFCPPSKLGPFLPRLNYALTNFL